MSDYQFQNTTSLDQARTYIFILLAIMQASNRLRTTRSVARKRPLHSPQDTALEAKSKRWDYISELVVSQISYISVNFKAPWWRYSKGWQWPWYSRVVRFPNELFRMRPDHCFQFERHILRCRSGGKCGRPLSRWRSSVYWQTEWKKLSWCSG